MWIWNRISVGCTEGNCMLSEGQVKKVKFSITRAALTLTAYAQGSMCSKALQSVLLLHDHAAISSDPKWDNTEFLVVHLYLWHRFSYSVALVMTADLLFIDLYYTDMLEQMKSKARTKESFVQSHRCAGKSPFSFFSFKFSSYSVPLGT